MLLDFKLNCRTYIKVVIVNGPKELLKFEMTLNLFFSLDPTYVKAYHRRANARAQLKRFAEAVQDFDKVLELEPKNKTAKAELEKLKEQMAEPKVFFYIFQYCCCVVSDFSSLELLI